MANLTKVGFGISCDGPKPYQTIVVHYFYNPGFQDKFRCFPDNKIEGIWIDVCTHGGSCLPCGVATLTPAGKEIEVYCLGGGIHGNEVQLRHGYDELYYCKVKIFGDMIG